MVENTQITRQEDKETILQRGTDIQFLQYLAKRNGFDVYVEVNPISGKPEGHFHPPRSEQKEQGVLTVNMGESTNIISFTTKFDMLKPAKTKAKNVKNNFSFNVDKEHSSLLILVPQDAVISEKNGKLYADDTVIDYRYFNAS